MGSRTALKYKWRLVTFKLYAVHWGECSRITLWGFSFEAGDRTFRPVIWHSMSGTLMQISEGFFHFFIIFCLLKQLMNLLTRGLQNEQLNSTKQRHYFLSLLSSLLDWFSFSFKRNWNEPFLMIPALSKGKSLGKTLYTSWSNSAHLLEKWRK